MARGVATLAAIAVSLLTVSGAGGAATQQTPKRGGTLVIGTRTASEPACLNVFVCDLPISVPGLLTAVLPGAFEVAPDATLRPNLVSRADIVSKSPFVVVYRIRPEARWSDGVPVTASDFEFTDRVRKTYWDPALDPNGWHRAHVRSVRPLDAKTARVVLKTRFADWRFLFDIVLPRHALAGEDFKSLWKDGIVNPKTRRPIGSGPFLLGDWRRGEHMTFVRNPRFWGPHRAYLERLVYRFLPPRDVAGALRRGEIDMIDPGPAVLNASAAEFRQQPAPGVTAVPTLGSSYEQFTIRTRGGHPALTKRLVRQALAYGIDRVAIARTIGQLSDASPAALVPSDSVVYVPTNPSYRPNWKRYRYRPAEARRLLEQAGCRAGQDGIYACDGNRLSLRFVTPAGIEARRRTLELAQTQLRRVGIDVRVVFAPPGTLFPVVLPSGNFDVALFGFGAGAATGGPPCRHRVPGALQLHGLVRSPGDS